MRLIKEELSGPNTPRSVWDDGNTIYKIMPQYEQTSSGLAEMCNKVNDFVGFRFFHDWIVEYNLTKVTMQKLRPVEIPINHDNIIKCLEFFIDSNIQLFPQAITDMSFQNIMSWNNEWVLIDWDDVLQGHQQLPEYIAGELIKECCKYNIDNIDTYINVYKNNTAGTDLEINVWEDIKNIILEHKDNLNGVQGLKFHKYYNKKGNDESTS